MSASTSSIEWMKGPPLASDEWDRAVKKAQHLALSRRDVEFDQSRMFDGGVLGVDLSRVPVMQRCLVRRTIAQYGFFGIEEYSIEEDS